MEKHKKIPKEQKKNKNFINKYNWEGINFPSEKDDQKKLEKNNITVVVNVLYAKKRKIYPARVSKNNSHRGKQVILLIISNQEKWHYLAVKKYRHY